ncbi:MAG: MBL fold metallo-hydrolase [Planctomycetota bacterium]
MRGLAALALVLALGVGLVAQPRPVDDAPYVLVLGTAQDGGLPQVGCERACCELARADPSRRRRVTSLLLVDPASGERWLFDASPDLPEQVELARGHPAARRTAPVEGGRAPLFDGIFPTHAHIGHYLGLAWLGREAYGARGQRVYGTERLREFLGGNGPWSLGVSTGGMELLPLELDEPLRLNQRLELTAFQVPHRDEFSDTVGFVIRGPQRALLYLPDIDKWERWERPIEDLIAAVDVALLDGTFFDANELPGRAMEEIPHPFIAESIERFASLAAAERAKVRFTHLNHSNPARSESGQQAAIRAAGHAVARDGERHSL